MGAQLIDKDPNKAVALFWNAINSGDHVDSALKDMAVVMKQLDRSNEAIEAIKSFRHLCTPDSQESLDNVLVELYKVSLVAPPTLMLIVFIKEVSLLLVDKFVIELVHNKSCIRGQLTTHKPDKVPF